MYHRFIFATGIENNTPTINNGKTRMDELDKCGHLDAIKKGLHVCPYNNNHHAPATMQVKK